VRLPLLHISSIRHDSTNRPVSLLVEGEIDMSSVDALDDAIRSILGPDPCVRVELDLSGVQFADSSALSLLLRNRQHYGNRFLLGRRSAAMSRLFEITGVDQILDGAVSPTSDGFAWPGSGGSGRHLVQRGPAMVGAADTQRRE
jgi:anti-anti-sigma factor